jgi:hypothetical protein
VLRAWKTSLFLGACSVAVWWQGLFLGRRCGLTWPGPRPCLPTPARAWPNAWQGPAGHQALWCPDTGLGPVSRLLNAAGSYRGNWKNTGRQAAPPRAPAGRAAAALRLGPAAWEALAPGGGSGGGGGRGRRPACQRERARARVSAAPSSRCPRRPPAGPPGLPPPPPPPPPAPPAAWQAAGCTGGGSRRSHDLSGCLSSSGSYSFPARKQPGLLSKPPWPQGRRGRPGVAALARSCPAAGPAGLPGTSSRPGGLAAGAVHPPIWLHLGARRKLAAGCYRPRGVGKVN